jgi:hypothetical protein
MHRSTSYQSEGPFPSQHKNSEDEVDDLENRKGFYRSIESLGEEVPKDFGPEESFECCCYLIYSSVSGWKPDRRGGIRTDCSSHNNETSPVVLDELSHDLYQVFPWWSLSLSCYNSFLKSQLLPKNVPDGMRKMKLRLKVVLVKK